MNQENYIKFFNDLVFYLNDIYYSTASINSSGEYPARINFYIKKIKLYIEMDKGYIYFREGWDLPQHPIDLPDIKENGEGLPSEENKEFVVKQIFQFLE